MGQTVPTHGFTHREVQQTVVREQVESSVVRSDLLEVHGTPPGSKPAGVCRILYENANGIDCRQMMHPKIVKARRLHDELEADVVAYNEHRLNLKHKDNRIGFSQLFYGGEADIRSVAAHNTHENVGRVQEGGTAMMVFGPMTQHVDPAHAKDPTGLGRWVVITLRGSDGFTTRIVCGYNPCGSGKANSGTVYQQHRRFFLTQRRSTTCPRVKFREDLLAQLFEWREKGDRLIVCLDANEDVYWKSLGKALTSTEGLAMTEVVGAHTGKKLGATYFRGSKPIDAIWATSDVSIASACVMPVGFGIGDHRLFVVDVLINSLVGIDPIRVVRPQARRLNTKIPSAMSTYNDELEKLVERHRLLERVGAAHKLTECGVMAEAKLNQIDAELKDYMISAENKCQKIKSGRIPYSPEAERWIRRSQFYSTLLRVRQGHKCNYGNLRRAAMHLGIHRYMDLSDRDIALRLQVCRDQ